MRNDKKRTLIFSILFLTGFTFMRCGGPFQSATKSMDEGKHQKAAKEFLEIAEKSSQTHQKAKAYHLAADVYRLANQPLKALPYYEEAVKLGWKEQDLGFHYAQALKMAGRYEDAAKEFKFYTQKGTDTKLRQRAMIELNTLPKIDSLAQENKFIELQHCEVFNTPGEDYSPVWNSGSLVFTSSKGGKIYEATGTGFTDLFTLEFPEESEGCTGEPQSLSDAINLDEFHEASATFSKDGKTMVFARSNSGKKKDTNKEVGLYISYFRSGEWSEPKPLPFSDEEHWDSSPAISADGQTLYFASDRPGGYGGTDIWRAKKSSRGTWAKISNMGAKINTAGNELFPYVAEDAKLYFSSDGHMGLGGLDIFEAVRSGGKILVTNMGKPFNSSADDLSISFLPGKKKGFFASSRITDESKGSDDIYFFVDTTPEIKAHYYLEGVTVQEKDNEGAVQKEALSLVKLQLKNASGELLEEATSDEEGNFKFTTQLEIGPDYIITGEKETFISHTQTYVTADKKESPEKYADRDTITDVYLKAEVKLIENIFKDIKETKEITLNNILYDLNKATLRPEAKRELDKLVEFLKSEPEMRVELGSHTDSRGGNRFNAKLSDRRSKSAVDYIVANGISRGRIEAKGYGETDLLIEDAQTEEEHQLNRRTTIRLLENEEGEE